jgi:hypothetical protein
VVYRVPCWRKKILCCSKFMSIKSVTFINWLLSKYCNESMILSHQRVWKGSLLLIDWIFHENCPSITVKEIILMPSILYSNYFSLSSLRRCSENSPDRLIVNFLAFYFCLAIHSSIESFFVEKNLQFILFVCFLLVLFEIISVNLLLCLQFWVWK